MTGDFNADKASDAYQTLVRPGQLLDVYGELHPQSAGEATYHGFGNTAEESGIDWILASRPFRPLEAAIDQTRDGAVYPSDHYPLTAVLELPESPGQADHDR
jgi:endonuclease/exonuclease/phosphatase family metal-dependent hydrolase